MKKAISIVLAMVMCLSFLPAKTFAADYFDIQNGILAEGRNPGGEIVIPDGVTQIGKYSSSLFASKNISSVTILSNVTTNTSSTQIVDGIKMGTYQCLIDAFGQTYNEAFRPSLTLRANGTFSILANLGYGMGAAHGTWTTWHYEGTWILLTITENGNSDLDFEQKTTMSGQNYNIKFYTELNDGNDYDDNEIFLGDWLGITSDYSRFVYVGAADTTSPVGSTVTESISTIPTSSTVLVNGRNVAFGAYNINNNNYFKLRDIAYILNGTEKQFAVDWDGVNDAILLTSGQPYKAIGGEMGGKGVGMKTAIPTDSRILLNGQDVYFTAFYIEGNNYFKLRDIGEVFNFGVDWDGANNTIIIDTGKAYTP